ncbi:MAG: MFS transporter [Cyanobacteria bacterium P01_G01_bin.54]
MQNYPQWLQGLKNPVFARLYLAQTINLVGESLTWLGLALLAFELAGAQASVILATALTLRVMTFVVLSPLAGAIADQVNRKHLMIATHLARMVIVCCLPFINQTWQIYAIVLSLNLFYAFFTPTYKATIPLVTSETECPKAIALSSATYQLLGVLGPGLAGGIAAWVGTRQVFFLDGVTFLVAACLIATLPGQCLTVQNTQETRTVAKVWANIKMGTTCLFRDPPIRYALVLQLIAAIAGAAVLVNTVNYVQGILELGKVEYGWVMAAFGIGATLASVGLGNARQSLSPIVLTSVGAVLITLALFAANLMNLFGLLVLWAIAGVGQTLVDVPTQTLIADRVSTEAQGRVYGAHFAWSHLWWAFAYPLAGWLGTALPHQSFFYGSLLGLALLVVVYVVFNPRQLTPLQPGVWHDHDHHHDHHHQHHHSVNGVMTRLHNHLHFHPKSGSSLEPG